MKIKIAFASIAVLLSSCASYAPYDHYIFEQHFPVLDSTEVKLDLDKVFPDGKTTYICQDRTHLSLKFNEDKSVLTVSKDGILSSSKVLNKTSSNPDFYTADNSSISVTTSGNRNIIYKNGSFISTCSQSLTAEQRDEINRQLEEAKTRALLEAASKPVVKKIYLEPIREVVEGEKAVVLTESLKRRIEEAKKLALEIENQAKKANKSKK